MKLLLAADLHLGKPFSNGKSGSVTQKSLRDATHLAFTRLVNTAIEQHVDALLLAGDILDIDFAVLRARLFFIGEVKRLAEAGVPVFIVHGNHDPMNGTSWSGLPENCHVFGSTPEERCITTASGEVLGVVGCSHQTKSIAQNLASQFPQAPDTDVKVALLHANLGGAGGHENYAPCQLNDLQGNGYDLWLLGHVHTRMTAQQASPAVLYPGSLQGLSIRETDAHGAVMAEISHGQVRTEFLPMDVLRWHSVEIDLTGCDDLPQFYDKVQSALEALASFDLQCVVRLTLSGRTVLHDELRKSDDVAASLIQGGVVFESVRDNTLPAIDPDEYEGKESVMGEVVKRSREWVNDAEQIQHLTSQAQEMAKKYGCEITEDDIRQAVAEAGIDALGSLSGEV
ncbi:MAG: metallophosphoesterase family protein [Armatimonadota bacterium]